MIYACMSRERLFTCKIYLLRNVSEVANGAPSCWLGGTLLLITTSWWIRTKICIFVQMIGTTVKQVKLGDVGFNVKTEVSLSWS